MSVKEWPWAHLHRHSEVIDRLGHLVQSSEDWRWLEVCCSLAAGRGDELSDVDAAVGYADSIPADGLELAGMTLVAAIGSATDVLAQVMPGWPAETRRFAVEFDIGMQLDLVLMPATRRVGLPTGSVAVVDKDGHLSSPWQPPVEEPPSPAVAREWTLLAWWALSDVDKHRRRGSLYEAVERLNEARQHALRLHATGERTPFPSLGLVSLLDFPPFHVPEALARTYALPDDPKDIARAARATAALLADAAGHASAVLGVALTTAWADTVRQRLEAVDEP